MEVQTFHLDTVKYFLKKEGYEKNSDKSYLVLYIRLYICGDYIYIEK